MAGIGVERWRGSGGGGVGRVASRQRRAECIVLIRT